jgi:hypothetical protein
MSEVSAEARYERRVFRAGLGGATFDGRQLMHAAGLPPETYRNNFAGGREGEVLIVADQVLIRQPRDAAELFSEYSKTLARPREVVVVKHDEAISRTRAASWIRIAEMAFASVWHG